MRPTFILPLLLVACPVMHSQSAPSASSGSANLQYSIRYSETAAFGGSLDNSHAITPSASLDYANGRKRFPFSVDYAGGYTSTLSGPAYATGFFQRLHISQEFNHRKWSFGLNDDVSYLPQSPTTGFSGIPGIGEPIGGGTGLPPSQLILTINTYVLDNIAAGELQHILNSRSTLNVEASYDWLHFPDGNGLDTNSAKTSAGLDFRLDARNSLTTRYVFSQFDYSGYDLRTQTNAVLFGFNRSWSRSFRTSAAAGPEWVNSSRSTILPASTGVTAHAALSYQKRRTSIGIAYSRETTAGSGYMIGSESDAVSGSLSTQVNRALVFEMNGGYRHNAPLATNWNISGGFGGAQASWRIGRNLSAFVNYTGMSQNSSMRAPGNVLNEVIHTVSCGIGFTKETKPVR